MEKMPLLFSFQKANLVQWECLMEWVEQAQRFVIHHLLE